MHPILNWHNQNSQLFGFINLPARFLHLYIVWIIYKSKLINENSGYASYESGA